MLHRSSVQHSISQVSGLWLTVANNNFNLSQAFFLSTRKESTLTNETGQAALKLKQFSRGRDGWGGWEVGWVGD